MQLIGILLITISIIGGYYYWEHQVVSAALDDRNREIELQSVAIQSAENAKIEIIRQHDKETYEGAINAYADYATRLRNSAKASSGQNRMPTKANCPERADRSSEEALSIKAVELLIEQFLIPNSEVK